MHQKFTKTIGCFTALIWLLFSSFTGQAQLSRTVESGGYLTALAKDNQGNLYSAKYNAGSDKYDIVKYNNATTPPVTIYSGLAYDGVDYVWGIAVDSHGNVFVAGSTVDDNVIKLSYNSGTNSYSSSVIMSGSYCTALAIDASDNLYTAEYNSGTNKYQIIRYAVGTYTGGTVLYNNINLAGGYTYPTSIVLAPNNDLYFNLAFGNSTSPDQGGVLKLTAASNYTAVTTVSSGKYSTAVGVDQLGNVYASEYDAGSEKFVLNKYTNGTGTPSQLYTLDDGDQFYSWGIAVFNSDDIYFITGASSSHVGGALVQLYSSPITQATNIVPSAQTSSAMTLNWTNGSGEKRAVFVSQGNSGTPSLSNNTTYAANANYGSGSKDASGNWYCVYNGTGSSVALTDLQADQSYRVMVMDYNGNPGLEQYLAATAAGNPVNVGVSTISSIVRADPDNTYENTLHYTVSFGSPVTGLSILNFSLTSGPFVSGAIVSNVSTVSGSVYTVTVNTSGGWGDLTLNLVNTMGITPALVSALPFAGETYHLNSTDANLADLTTSEGTLDPVFSANTTSYSVTVHDPSIMITPTAVNAASTIMVGSQIVPSGEATSPISLNEGPNTISVVVLSTSSPLSKSYILNVTYDKPLPVTWVDFNAAYQQGQYIWSWKLGVESQIAYYQPEYSLDGIKFMPAGKVSDKNTSLSYKFSKALNLQGLVYFRVKALNTDGSSSYSTTKTLQTGAAGASMVVYPNPVGAQLHLSWPNTTATTLDVSVYNTVGKKVLQQKVSNASVVTLQVGGLAAGSYYLVVEDNQQRKITSGLFLKK